MGLTVTYGCFSGHYSAFDWWRRAIATTAGIPIEKMAGYCEDKNVTPISWDTLEPDWLFVLLLHSDCDGGIAAEYCRPLAERLQQLLDIMKVNSSSETDEQVLTRKFIRGLRRAVSRNKGVEFV